MGCAGRATPGASGRLSRRLDLQRKRDDEQRPGAGRALDPDRPAEGLDAIMQADESRAVARAAGRPWDVTRSPGDGSRATSS